VRGALGCVVKAIDRAGNIVDRIRSLVKKMPPRSASLDINNAISESIGLTRSEVVENGATVPIRLAEGLSSVQGDRVQL
jgi:C4-dicarboxylate-specific signal transduction histidine kinase